MGTIRIGEKSFDVDVAVFDKDGLLFDSAAFWLALTDVRMRAALTHMPAETVAAWSLFMGVRCETSPDGMPRAIAVDSFGPIAVASPDEERLATAAFFMEHLSLDWDEAKALAADIMDEADAGLDYSRAVRCKKGISRHIPAAS